MNVETRFNHKKLHLCPRKCPWQSHRNLAPVASFRDGLHTDRIPITKGFHTLLNPQPQSKAVTFEK